MGEAKPRVLVVDDEMALAETIADGLEGPAHGRPGVIDVTHQLFCCFAHSTSSLRVSTVRGMGSI